MKLPRAIGKELVAALRELGNEITRQSGSHIRLTTQVHDTHHFTIPDHRPLKVGTLSAILRDMAQHHGLDRDELVDRLF